MTIEDYQRLAGDQITVIQALAQHDVQDFDFEPPRVRETYVPDPQSKQDALLNP